MFVSTKVVDRLMQELAAERQRYDTLLAEVLRRGLRDEAQAAPLVEAEKPLPEPIAIALSHWPDGSAVYKENLSYALAQLAVRGVEAADEIAMEIKQGEDVELYL